MRLKDTKTVKKMIDRMNANEGTSDYNDLANKPTINGNDVVGNLTSADLGLSPEVKPFVLTADASWLSGEEVTIEDEENLEVLGNLKEAVKDGEQVSLGLMLPTGEVPYNVFQSTAPFYGTEEGEGDEPIETLYLNGFGYIGVFGYTFVDVVLSYSSAVGSWKITLTPLFTT